MSGRLTRTLGAAVLVVGGLTPVASAGHTPPVIAGETVVVASRTSAMRVYIPRRAAVSIDVAKSVRIEGSGRLVGVLLREDHPDRPDQASFLRLPAQMGGRTYVSAPADAPACTSSVPDPLPDAAPDCSGAKPPAHYSLRRGTYTLYALTDGAPIRVTLRFANLRGSTRLAPSRPRASGHAAFAPSVETAAAWAGGATALPDGPAYLFALGWWKQDESPAGGAGTCIYEGGAPVRWVPGCPGASGFSASEVRNPVYGSFGQAKGGAHSILGTTYSEGDRPYGLGVWMYAQNVRDAGGLAVWLAR